METLDLHTLPNFVTEPKPHGMELMLEQTQASLHHYILQDTPGRNIDCAALVGDDDDSSLQSDATSKIHRAGDGQMVQFDDPWDGRDPLLEVRHFLEVRAQFDQGSGSKSRVVNIKLSVLERVQVRLHEHQIRASLDR